MPGKNLTFQLSLASTRSAVVGAWLPVALWIGVVVLWPSLGIGLFALLNAGADALALRAFYRVRWQGKEEHADLVHAFVAVHGSWPSTGYGNGFRYTSVGLIGLARGMRRRRR